MNRCPVCGENLSNEIDHVCPSCGNNIFLHNTLNTIDRNHTELKLFIQELSSKINDQEKLIGLIKRESTIETTVKKEAAPAESPAVPVAEIDTSVSKKTESDSPPLSSASAGHVSRKIQWGQRDNHDMNSQPSDYFISENFSKRFGEIQIGQKGLLILGIILTVFGVGYFLKFAFEQNWVGPVGRVTGSYFWGLAFLLGGEYLRRKIGSFGTYIAGGGLATLFLTTFAANSLYHLIPTYLAFIMMAAVAALTGLTSVRYDAKWLAMLGMVGGFLTPFLVSTDHPNDIVFLSYIALLNGGVFYISGKKNWRILNITTFFFTWTSYSVWYADRYDDDLFSTALIFLNLFYVIHSILPYLYHMANENIDDLKGMWTGSASSFIAIGYSYAILSGPYGKQSVAASSLFYAIIPLILATIVQKKSYKNSQVFSLLSGQTLFYLTLTIFFLFEGEWITVFLFFQAALTFFYAAKIRNPILVVGGLILYNVAIIKLLMYDYGSGYLRDGSLSGEFAKSFVERYLSILSFVLSSSFIYKIFTKEVHPDKYTNQLVKFIAMSASGLTFFILLNVETEGFFSQYLPGSERAAISIAWGLFSSGLIAVGFRKNIRNIRIISLILFVITAIKVFLYDMADVRTPYRILSFIVLGLLLIGASFLYYRFLADSDEKRMDDNADQSENPVNNEINDAK